MSLEKIISLEDLIPVIRDLKSQGKRIAFTNGCFDLIHTGHIHLLERSGREGDCLVVGLNTDASIKRLKGERRPLLTQDQRGRILASFEAVDYVVFFDEDTPARLMEALAPDVLIKGGDYSMDQVVGREKIWEGGGDVICCTPIAGQSTTAVIEDILKRFSE